MFKRKNTEEKEVINSIKQCVLFSDLGDKELKELNRIVHVRDYSQGEKVFTEGTMGLCFYLIIRGSVQIISQNSGNVNVIKEYGKGAYFSEIHLFSETNHTVSCITKEITKLIVLSKPDFESLMKIKPAIANKILARFLEFFGNQLDKMYMENIELRQKIVKS
jgi:CRP/FNR family cyclic AMP-dependent transcriptional regulator